MATLRRSLAEQRGVAGFWAEAVTNHISSQREILRLGGSEVGLLIGGSPAAVVMAGFENPSQGRRTLMTMFTALVRGARTIHVAERHREFVGELAARAGLRAQGRVRRRERCGRICALELGRSRMRGSPT